MKLLATLLSVIIVFTATAQTAPIFTGGTKQTLSVCKNSGANSIDTKMIVLDPDANQTINYIITTAPVKGTVHGFSKVVATGTGGVLTPTGFDYQPNTNFIGLDSFTVNISDGSFTAQTKIIVTVNDLPLVANITGTTTVCITGNTQLFNATTGGVWSSSNGFVASVNSTGYISAQAQGNTIITYSVTNAGTGCTNSVTTSIAVVIPPAVQPITGNTVLCAGAATQLSSLTSGGVWSSNDTNVIKVNATGWATGISGGATTINYTAFTAPACSTTVNTNIVVNSLPVLSAISANKTLICVGANAYVSNTNTIGYWSSNNKAIATVNSTGEVTGTGVGIATIKYRVINANNCSDSVKIDINVAAAPATAPTVGPDKMCVGTSVTVTNAVSGGQWSILPSADGTIDANGLVTAIKPSYLNIYYTQHGASGCVSTVYFYITSNALPVVAGITGNTQVCVGGFTNLSNSTPNGVWSSSNTSIATVDSTGKVVGVSAGVDTIYYKVTNANNCVTKVSFVITVNATLSVPPITGGSSVCMGSSLVLANTLSGGVWASTDNKIAVATGSTIYPVTVGVATISYTVGTGICKGVAYKNIVVNPAPVVGAISGAAPVCSNGTYQYTNTTPNGVWTSSNLTAAVIDINGLLTTKTITAATSTTLTYTVTNQYGCVTSVTKPVNVNVKPVLAAITGPDAICVGSKVTLKSTTTFGTWRIDNTNLASISTSGLLTGIAPGTVKVYKTHVLSGCMADTVFKMVYIDTAIKIAPIQGSSKICIGGSTKYYYTSATTGGSWSCSDTSKAFMYAATTDKPDAVPKDTGKIYVVYTVNQAANCIAKDSIAVTIFPKPTTPVITSGRNRICQLDTTQLIATPSGGKFTSFDNYGSIILDTITGFVRAYYDGSALIRYTISDSNSCQSYVSFSLTIDTAISIGNTYTLNQIFCVGDTTTFKHSTPGGVWQAGPINSLTTPANNFDLISINSLTGFATMQKQGTQYCFYYIKQISGCPKVWSTWVKVGMPNNIDSTVGAKVVCVGATSNLYNNSLGGTSGTTKGTWSSSNNSIATVSTTGVVKAISAGNCTIDYAVDNSNYACVAHAKTNLVVNPIPVLNPINTPLGLAAVCVNDSIKLSNSATGGIWMCSDTSKAIIDSSSGNLKGKTAGAMTIGYTVFGGGCNATTFVNGMVYDLPQVSAISGTDTVCVGSSTTLINDSSGGKWESTDTLIATVSASGIVKGLKSGKVTIIYKRPNSNGCIKGISKDIVVVGLPVISAITGNNILCSNTKSNLNNTTVNGIWRSVDSAIAKVSNVGQLSGVNSGTTVVYYTVSGSGGCRDSVSTNVTVNAKPTVGNIVGNLSVCVNGATKLVNTTPGGVWSVDDIFIAGIDNSGNIVGLSGGTTRVKYKITDLNACSDSTVVFFKVNPKPVIAAITGNKSVCVESTSLLSCSTSGGTWKSLNTNLATVNSIGSVYGVANGNATIQYIVTNGNGCTDSVNTIVTVNTLPNKPVIAGITSLCQGSSVVLSASVAGGSWGSSNTSVATANSTTGQIVSLGSGVTSISYTIQDANNCSATANVNFTVNPKPILAATSNSPVPIGQTIQLNASSIDAIASWSWVGPNGFNSSLANPSITTANATMTGSYKVVGLSGLGCISDSTKVDVVVGDSYTISGRMITPLKKAINKNNIKLTGTLNNTYSVDANGIYTCSNLSVGNYNIKPSIKNNDISKANGVTSVDVLLTQRHILNTSKLNSPYKIIAADVTGDKQINSTDVLRMKRLILGTDTTFTSSTRGSRLWEFVDSAYAFPDTTNPFPFKDSISITNLTSNKTNQTFIGVKLGDVNYDWNPAVARGVAIKSLELIINSEKQTTNNVKLTVTSSNFNNIAALQTTLHFDNTKYEFVSIESNKILVDYNASKANQTGNIALLWTDKNAEAKSFDKEEILFTIVLKPLTVDSRLSTKLQLNNDIAETEAWDNNLVKYNLVLQQKATNPDDLNMDGHFVIYPNPATDFVNVDCSNAKQIIITNAAGCIIKKLNTTLNHQRIDVKEFTKGLYIIQSITLNGSIINRKLIIR